MKKTHATSATVELALDSSLEMPDSINSGPASPFVENMKRPMSSAERVEIRVLRSREEVEQVRHIWSAWPTHRDSNIDFCLEIVWTRGEVIRPHVILLFRDGVPDAMLTGRLERTRMVSKIGYLQIPGVPALSLTFSYRGLLGNDAPENCREIFASVEASLRSREADLATVDHPVAGETLHTLALAQGVATRDHLSKPSTHYRMTLPPDAKDLYSSLSANHRSSLKRKAKKLMGDHQGNVVVTSYRQLAELNDLVETAEQIAKGTYQRGLGVGFHNDAETQRRLRLYAENGWLRGYVLRVSGTPCAFWIGSLYSGCFCSDYLAFDTSFGAYSPGTFLLTKVAEEFCASGVREIDFGFGDARYKEQFGNSPLKEASVLIFAPNFQGVMLNAMRTAIGLVNNLITATLDRTGLLPRLKRLWRRRVANDSAVE